MDQETHICKYCKAEVTQPDEECYMAPVKGKTAVEWLIEKLDHLPPIDERFESEFNSWQDAHYAWDKMRDQLIEQARQMEKDQIVNAVDGFPLSARGMSGEEYYSETYNAEQK